MEIINSKEGFSFLREVIPNFSVEKVDISALKKIRDEMFQYLEENKESTTGVASNQIGLKERFFAMRQKKGNLLFCVNPTYHHFNNLDWSYEGCLSLKFDGSIQCYLLREKTLHAHYYRINHNDELKLYTTTLKGIDSFTFQHEIDHLDGLFILDRAVKFPIENIKRDIKYKKIFRLIKKEALKRIKQLEKDTSSHERLKTLTFEPLENKEYFDYLFESDTVSLYNKENRDIFSEETEVVAVAFLNEEKKENGSKS